MTERDEGARSGAVGGEVGLVEAVGVLVRRWWLVAVAALAAGAAAAAVLIVTVPRTWESAATIVISPPVVTSELTPKPLSLQAYQKLLESGPVLARTRQRLLELGLIEPGVALHGGRDLEARIFVSRKSEETSLAPILLAVARAGSSKQAADIANTWAEVFLSSLSDLSASTARPAVESVRRSYDETFSELAALEAGRLEVATEKARARDAAADAWDRRGAERGAAAAAALAAYKAETLRLLAAYEGTHGLGALQAESAALRESHAALLAERHRATARLAQAEHELAAARAALAATPQLIEVRKAMSDDALWQSSLMSQGGGQAPATAERSLIGQEVNPLHTELASAVARLEIEVAALTPRAAQLRRQADEAVQAQRLRDTELADLSFGLETLRAVRQAGLVALEKGQEVEASVAGRERARELARLDGEAENALAVVERGIAARREQLAVLSRLQGQAVLASTDGAVTQVRLELPAVAPPAPARRGIAPQVAGATALGALLGILLAFSLEARSRAGRKEGE